MMGTTVSTVIIARVLIQVVGRMATSSSAITAVFAVISAFAYASDASASMSDTKTSTRKIENHAPDLRKLDHGTVRMNLSANPSSAISATPSGAVSTPAQRIHTEEQLKEEKEFSDRIVAVGHRMRRIRSKMNQLTKKQTYTEVEELLRTVAGNRSVAQTKLNQLKVCDPKEWDFQSKHVLEAIAELEASVTNAANRLTAAP